jgi:hypothetical protein
MTKAQKFRKKFGSVADTFADQNRKVVELILRHAAPADNGLATQWAKMVLARTGPREPAKPEGDRA